jgi:hypothetical protein
LTGICPVTVHNEIQERERDTLDGCFRVSFPSSLEVLRLVPSSLKSPPFHPYTLGRSAYPDGPFSALGPRSLLLPLSPVPQTHSLLFPLLSSTLLPSRFSSFLPSFLSFNFCAPTFSHLFRSSILRLPPPLSLPSVTAPSSNFPTRPLSNETRLETHTTTRKIDMRLEQ